MAGRIVDIFLVYQFLKRLATPFEKWKAYELGIIDKDGQVLKKRKELESQAEKNAWGYYDILVTNLKKLLAKVPFGKTRLASLAAAALLLKEYKEEDGQDPEDEKLLAERFDLYYNNVILQEEVSAGSGRIAGIGVGQDGEPGVTKKKQKEYAGKNEKESQMVTRGVKGMVS
jgi:hypothetical protein